MNVQNNAANNVPARLAASTIAQSRAMRTILPQVTSAATGKTAVIVISVNSCWRESTAMMNPMQ